MFGYIKPYTPELKVRDNEFYQSVYCGLCHSLGKETGFSSRMTLNYDLVFAALLRMAVTGEPVTVRNKRCIAHPFSKRNMADPSPTLNYCAIAGVLLSYSKADDDVNDEKGSKRAKAKAIRLFMKGMDRKAKKKINDLDNVIKRSLKELSDFEKGSAVSVDIPAEIFGKLMSFLISYDIEGSEGRILEKIGFHLGKWLYILDAADDYESDNKRGRYNPLLLLFDREPFDNEKKSAVFNALTAELMEIESAFDLLGKKETEYQSETFALIDNIIHLGMPDTAHGVLFEKHNKAKKKGLE